MLKKCLILLLVLVLSLSFASAVTINDIDADNLMPGGEGSVRIELENNLEDDVEDVFVNLKFNNLPFNPVGSSEKSEDKIDEDDEETFSFRIRAANNVKPGDYEIPYSISYHMKDSDLIKTRAGSIGIRVTGDPDLVYSVNLDNAVENQKGKISFKVVNKGYSDARFVSVKIVSTDFVLLSEEEVYMGTVDSDDFETAEFEVLFDRNPAKFKALVEYKDFDNNKIINTINLPLSIYSQEEALKLGITKKSRGLASLLVIVGLIILMVVYRSVKKKRRLKKSRQRERNLNKETK